MKTDKMIVKTLDTAPEYDGHTPQDVITRLLEIFENKTGDKIKK